MPFIRRLPPCPSRMKSSTKTSVCPSGLVSAMLEGGAGASGTGVSAELPVGTVLGILPRPGHHGVGQVIERARKHLEAVCGRRFRGALQSCVGIVACGFRHSGEGRGRLDPAHGARHRDRHQGRFPVVGRQEYGESGAVAGTEEEAVESVLQVHFTGSCRAEPGIGVSCQVQYARECSTELHGLGRSMVDRGFVDRGPLPWPGVVADESGLVVVLLLDSGRGEHQVFEVPHMVIGQDGPEPGLNELGHLFS